MAKRRPSGDGMVRLKKENQWEGRIVVGHKQNGDSIFRYAYGKTQKEMMQKLNVLKIQYQNADLNEESNITLSEWLDKWINELMPQAVRPTTLKGFELICRCYIKPYLGDKKIAFITTNDVQKMYAKLKKEGRINKHPVHGHKLADNMIIKIHSTLHLAMETAIEKNLIAKNPTEGTTVPKKKKKDLKVLNDSELDKLMQALNDDKEWGDFFYLELTTGLRRGEDMALKWEDLNFDTGELKVRRQVKRTKGRLVITEPKTEESVRTIILPKSLVNILKEYKETIDSEWMFPSPKVEGMPRDPSAVYGMMQVILERAECKKLRFHDLRHTFATTSVANGMDIKTLSTILGHVSSKTTLDIYLHSTDEMKQNAADKINARFSKDTSGNEETTDRQEKPPQAKFEPKKGKMRKPGTGCISKINDHLYEGRYSPKDAYGKRMARNIYAPTREECEEKLAILIKEMKAEIAEQKAKLKNA